MVKLGSVVIVALVLFFVWNIYSFASTFIFKGCPASCDDGNPCTLDYCGKDTDNRCVNRPLSGPQEGCNEVDGCVKYECSNGFCMEGGIEYCCGNGLCDMGETEEDCPDDCRGTCPEECDDGNNCTRDYCGRETQFKCVYEIILSPECNNTCPTSCDDGNSCTEDFCSNLTNFKCVNSPISPCCGDGVCDVNESLSCTQDCTIRVGSITSEKPVKGSQAADWIFWYSKDLLFQTDVYGVSFDLKCAKIHEDGSKGLFIPFISEKKSSGRFVGEFTEAYFSGFMECLSGLCTPDPAYSRDENKSTRLFNGSRGARARAVFYIGLKDRFFYDYGLNERTPKKPAGVTCDLTVFSRNPPQSVNESFNLTFIPSCNDFVQNQGELGVDCGGPCPACECEKDLDCGQSGFVSGRYCWEEFSETARDYRLVRCEKPPYARPFCNITVYKRSLHTPCKEKGSYTDSFPDFGDFNFSGFGF